MEIKINKWLVVVGSMVLLLSTAWAADAKITKAQATLAPTQGNTAEGQVIFTEVADGVKIVVDVKGLKPGAHGFHIHEYGDCSAPDGKSAGGHFNPTEMSHGGPDMAEHHVGDLGNLEVDKNGNAHLEFTEKGATLQSGTNSIIGRSVIIHASADDLKSQPAGASGERVACGIIGIIKP